jgi:hypothetical protein
MKAVRPPQLPSDIRALLAEARPLDEPGVGDRERIGRALARTLGTPAQAWIAAPELVAVKTTLFGVKLLGLLAVLGVGAVGTWLAVHEHGQPRMAAATARETLAARSATSALEPQPSAASGVASNPARPSQPLAAEGLATPAGYARVRQPSAERDGITPRAAPDARLTANQQHRVSANARAPDARRDRLLTPAPQPRGPSSALARDVDLDTSHALSPSSEVPSAPEGSATRVSAAPPSTPAARAVLQDELRLITAASRALDANDLPRAADALRAHAERFTSGFLREEREALRAMLACERGDADAHALRGVFERHYPRSPERPRISQHCDHVR